MSHQRRP